MRGDWCDLPANAQTVDGVELCIDYLQKHHPYPANMKIDREAFAAARMGYAAAIFELEKFMAELTETIKVAEMDDGRAMNLYRIVFKHYCKKDNEDGIKTYILANSAEDVFDYMDKEYTCSCWHDQDEDAPCALYDDETETFREKILRLHGDINDDCVDFSDVYYGITLYGWELVKADVGTDFDHLIELGVAVRADIGKDSPTGDSGANK